MLERLIVASSRAPPNTHLVYIALAVLRGVESNVPYLALGGETDWIISDGHT